MSSKNFEASLRLNQEPTLFELSQPIRSGSCQSARSDDIYLEGKTDWIPGFRAQLPHLGIGCLTTVIILSIVSVVVLLVSNDKAVSQWDQRVAPNVILSLLNSLATICLAVAFSRGVAITWWRKALLGSTIEDLHCSYAFGYDFMSLFTRTKHFNFVAFAALAMKLSLVDSILFQRATTTFTALGPSSQHNISTFPTDAFPTTGLYDGLADRPKFLDGIFEFDVWTWLQSGGDSIYYTYGFGDCDGVCFTRYPGPGFVIQCSSQSERVDFVKGSPLPSSMVNNGSTMSTNLFDVSFNYTFAEPSRNYSWIGLNMTSYSTLNQTINDLCPAEILIQECELRPAILSYPVVTETTQIATRSLRGKDDENSMVSVYLGQLNDTSGSWQQASDFDANLGQVPGYEVLQYVNFTGLPSSFGSTLVGGIQLAMQDYFSGQASVRIPLNNSQDWEISNEGLFASLHIDVFGPGQSNVSCPPTVDNPFQDIVTSLNKLTFIMSDDLYNRPRYRALITNKSASQAELDTYWQENVRMNPSVRYRSEVHYRTVTGYMWGAFATTLVCVACILPTFWGFWQLGRHVSLDPVEIAYAFASPVFADSRGIGGHSDDIVKVIGKKNVRYEQDSVQDRVFRRART